MTLFLKNLAFTVLVPGVVAVVVPFLLAGRPVFEPRWPIVIALPIAVLGCAMYTWCVWDFAFFGRGTPAPIDAPRKLVVHGLYRFTRNPMYVAVLAIIMGWAIHLAEASLLIYWIVVAVAFHLFVVFYEEPSLRRAFGREYDDYRAAVGRWIPRFHHASRYRSFRGNQR